MCDRQDKSGAASMAAAHTPATDPPDELRDGQASCSLRKLMTSSAALGGAPRFTAVSVTAPCLHLILSQLNLPISTFQS